MGEVRAPVMCPILVIGPLAQVLPVAISIFREVHISEVSAGTYDSVDAWSTADIQQTVACVLACTTQNRVPCTPTARQKTAGFVTLITDNCLITDM